MKAWETKYEYLISTHEEYDDKTEMFSNAYNKRSINGTISFIKDKFCIPFFFRLEDLPNYKEQFNYLKSQGAYFRVE